MENLEAKNNTPTVDEVNSYGLSMAEWMNLSEDEKDSYRNQDTPPVAQPSNGENLSSDEEVSPETNEPNDVTGQTANLTSDETEWDKYGITEADWNNMPEDEKENYRAVGTVHKEEEVNPDAEGGAEIEKEV